MKSEAPLKVDSENAREAVRPLPMTAALGRIARCAGKTAVLLASGELHQPDTSVGQRLTFADGTSARIYRETVADGPPPAEPVVLVVTFRMWLLNGHRGRAYFRLVSLLNTPLFAGFPGFSTKLWLAADEQGRYRGLYEWDGARRAEEYVQALWWPLRVISHRDSIRYRVMPGRRRADLLAASHPNGVDSGWWAPLTVEPSPT